MMISLENITKQILAAVITEHGDDWQIYYESLIEYISLGYSELNENSSFLDDVEYLCIDDTPLAILGFDIELQEKALNFFWDNRKYKKDKDGKVIVGMNKLTTRYKGSEQERRRQAVKKYYSNPENYARHKKEMRDRYHQRMGQQRSDKAAERVKRYSDELDKPIDKANLDIQGAMRKRGPLSQDEKSRRETLAAATRSKNQEAKAKASLDALTRNQTLVAKAQAQNKVQSSKPIETPSSDRPVQKLSPEQIKAAKTRDELSSFLKRRAKPKL